MKFLSVLLFALAFAATPASAELKSSPTKTSKEQAAASKKEKPAPEDAPTAEDPSLDFDLLEPAAPPAAIDTKADEALERQVNQRRTMLTVHQALGIATWTGLLATEVVGQLELNDKYRGGGDPERLAELHLGLALGTTVLFSSVALLGVLAPVPFKRKEGFSTVSLHKLMMAVATAGMLTQVGLGLYTNSREGNLDQRAFAQAHQIVGYTTLGAMTVGAVSLVF